MNNFKINVINISDLPKEKIEKFKSDFRIIADYFYQIYHGESYVPYDKTMDHQDAVLKTMTALTGDHRFEDSINVLNATGKENVRMCKALDIIEERGIKIGEDRGVKIFIKDKLEDNIPESTIIEKLKKNYDMTEDIAKAKIKECMDDMSSK